MVQIVAKTRDSIYGSSNERMKSYALPLLSMAGLAIGGVFYLYFLDPGLGRIVWYATLIICGAPIIYKTILKMIAGKYAVDIIATLAIVTAILMDESFAGVIIVLMQSSGEALEHFGLSKASFDLRKLLDNRPKIAHRKIDSTIVDISADDAQPGDILLIKPGELIPVDGDILSGESDTDDSSITGEARLIHRKAGESVMSGTINVSFPLEIIARRTSEDSQFSRIVGLVRKAQEDRAPIVRIADRYGIWLIPATLILAFAGWLYTGNATTILAVFVVATPCPLILATPIALMGGLSKAAKKGIIVKGGSAIEQLGKSDVAIFDKTGTITTGEPQIDRIIQTGKLGNEELLRISGISEQLSTHPVAKRVYSTAKEKLGELPLPDEFKEFPGQGVTAVIEGRQIAVGNYSFCTEFIESGKPEIIQEMESRAVMYSCIVVDRILSGIIVFSDRLRPGVPELIPELKASGMKEILMLTGDNKNNASAIASKAGITKFMHDLKPEDKLKIIQEEKGKGQTVLMVGDGVNDAPALAMASVGIAMGARGADISAETAHVILTIDDVTKVGDAVQIGRRTLRIAMQSITFGIFMSVAFMIIAAMGYIFPSEGAVIQEIIDAVSIFNSMRASL